MIILRHNSLTVKELFVIERVMLKVSSPKYRHTLDYSILNKSRGEVYGHIAGLCKHIGLYKTLGITISDFLDLLVDIERGYNDNPYHSFYHAVDVAMVLYHMLEEYNMSEHLTRFDVAMLILAGLCHDIGHPGNNNHFEVSCQTEKAKQYNNLSVLESHSAQVALDLFDKHNLLQNVELNSRLFGIPITKNEFKSNVVRMILATDMICHFNLKDNVHHLHDIVQQKRNLQQTYSSNVATETAATFKPLFSLNADPFTHFKNTVFNFTINDEHNECDSCTPSTTCHTHKHTDSSCPTPTVTPLLNKQQRLMMCNILIHAADISNPCRPWSVFYKLSRLVCVEFFRQGDKERARGLPVTPSMDKTQMTPSKINVGFIDFIVQPYFEALSKLFPCMSEFVERCKQNREEWLSRDSETIDTLCRNIPSIKVTMGTFPLPEQPYSPEITASSTASSPIMSTVAATAATTTAALETLNANTLQVPVAGLSAHSSPVLEEDLLRGRRFYSRSRSITDATSHASAFLSPYWDEVARARLRRKSEDVLLSTLRQVQRRRLSSVTKPRRKSDESNNYMTRSPKVVSFFELD